MRSRLAGSPNVALLLALTFAFTLAPAPCPAAEVQPIASAPTNFQGVTLDLMSVERKGSVLTIKWAAHNTGAERKNVRFGLVGDLAKTYLVDEENGTKYFALTDKEGKGVAVKHDWIGSGVSGVNDDIDAGVTMRYWAKFPAPPPAVKKLTILFDETEPFEDVPVTDK